MKPPLDGDREVPVGARVVIHGLKKATSCNWTSAVVVRGIVNGRYRVHCARGPRAGQEINVKPSNLCLCPEADAVKVDFKSRTLDVCVSGRNILSGSLPDLAIAGDCTWYLSEDRLPQLIITKFRHEWWSCVLNGDPKIDVDILEGEKFLDEKYLDRLRARKAQERAEAMAKAGGPKNLEELRKVYAEKLTRVKTEHKKRKDTRAFVLWTRKARAMAGLSTDFRSPVRFALFYFVFLSFRAAHTLHARGRLEMMH